jgi:hypothetical protein
MDTEDAGVVPVQVVRNADGSVSIIDLGPNGRNTEYPAAFVKDKSDEALLQYTYEPIGFQGATATGGSGKPPSPPRTPPPPDSPEAAREKMLSKISVRESNDKEPMTFQKLYTDLIDDLNPIREAVKKAAKNGALPTSDDPYQLARLTRGTFGKANQFLEYGTFDFKTYENNGPSLRAILKGEVRDLPEITDAEPVDLDTLRAYIKAKRDLELVSRGVADPDVDVDAATQVVKHWGQYERVAKELTAYQNRLTAYLRDAGIISADDYDAMLKANKDYVPFFRVMDEDVGGAGLGRGVKTKNPIKSIKGSERNIIDPIESIIKNTYMYLSLAERNAVGTRLSTWRIDPATPACL